MSIIDEFFTDKMKIQNQNNYIYSQNKPKQPAFKGYFACPIKELHFQSCGLSKQRALFKELNQKCSKYFDIFVQLKDKIVKPTELEYQGREGFAKDFIKNALDVQWGQDNKIFLDKNKLGILTQHPDLILAKKFGNILGIETKSISAPIHGGNCFLGKKQNGEAFALIGNDALTDSSKITVANQLEVMPKNLHVISQPEAHLDLIIRPLNFPYVLIGDSNLTMGLAEKHNKLSAKHIEYFKKTYNNRKFRIEQNDYVDIDTTINELKEQGFKPVRVPGFIGNNIPVVANSDLNFMNAIVHQEDDGSLIYITNKTNLKKEMGIDFEEIFENYLKLKVPSIKEVIFVDGDGLIAQNLRNSQGGIHCMNTERPNFNKWEALLAQASNSLNQLTNNKTCHEYAG